jgi:hypothetical protein
MSEGFARPPNPSCWTPLNPPAKIGVRICSLTIGADWYRPDGFGLVSHVEVHVGLVKKRAKKLIADDTQIVGRIGFDSDPVRLAA